MLRPSSKNDVGKRTQTMPTLGTGIIGELGKASRDLSRTPHEVPYKD